MLQELSKKAKCKQALAKYVELVQLTTDAQVKMLELLMHPECSDEMALQVVRTRRNTIQAMREARDTLAEKLYEAGLIREANLLLSDRF